MCAPIVEEEIALRDRSEPKRAKVSVHVPVPFRHALATLRDVQIRARAYTSSVRLERLLLLHPHDGQCGCDDGRREARRPRARDFFGEIAILGDGRRTATVTTTSPSQLLVMFGTEFRRL
jgi:hypothetical protein